MAGNPKAVSKATAKSLTKSAPRTVAKSSPNELWLLLIEFALSQRGWWTEICNTLELTPTQGLTLRLLDPDKPMAMNVLADTLACDASNVTGVVDKLEARGLIARQAAEGDRRLKILVVTDKGREVRDRLFDEAAKPPALITELPRELHDRMSGVLRAMLAERKLAGTAG